MRRRTDRDVRRRETCIPVGALVRPASPVWCAFRVSYHVLPNVPATAQLILNIYQFNCNYRFCLVPIQSIRTCGTRTSDYRGDVRFRSRCHPFLQHGIRAFVPQVSTWSFQMRFLETSQTRQVSLRVELRTPRVRRSSDQ